MRGCDGVGVGGLVRTMVCVGVCFMVCDGVGGWVGGWDLDQHTQTPSHLGQVNLQWVISRQATRQPTCKKHWEWITMIIKK